MDKNLSEAAMDLGCTPWQTFSKVELPSLMPGILSGLITAFTISLDDFVVSYFTTGSSFETLSIHIYTMTKKTVHPDMYALSTIIFAIVFVLLILSNVIGKDDGKTKKLKRNKLSAIFKNRGR
jgi:spermidine/putrescine transport system permease protein